MKRIVLSSLLLAWFCVSDVHAQSGRPKGNDDPPFTISGGLSALGYIGPAHDTMAEMSSHGFGADIPGSRSCFWIFGCVSNSPKTYPRVNEGSRLNVRFGIDYLVSNGVRVSASYAQFDHGAAIGRTRYGQGLTLDFSLKSVEPSIVLALPNRRKFPLDVWMGLGPGVYVATVESGSLAQKETRVGVVMEAAARTPPQTGAVFAEFRASYRYVGEASFGPYTGGDDAAGTRWTFSESQASFNTLSISVGVGLRLGKRTGN